MRKQSHHFDEDNIEMRLVSINSTYKRLKKLAEARARYLEDAIKLFTFYHDCDEFQDWMKEKVRSGKEVTLLLFRLMHITPGEGFIDVTGDCI